MIQNGAHSKCFQQIEGENEEEIYQNMYKDTDSLCAVIDVGHERVCMLMTRSTTNCVTIFKLSTPSLETPR
jgi:hypothetical protein